MGGPYVVLAQQQQADEHVDVHVDEEEVDAEHAEHVVVLYNWLAIYGRMWYDGPLVRGAIYGV